METLDIFHQIKSEMLNQKYYFQSLIEQACYCGLLSDKERVIRGSNGLALDTCRADR